MLGKELISVDGKNPKKSIKAKDIATGLKIIDKIGEVVAGSEDWFEKEEQNINWLTEAYKTRGVSERKARYIATRELLEQSYKKK